MELKEQIQQMLSDFWDEQALEASPEGDIPIDCLAPPLDSLAAVEVLVALDKLLGKKIPDSVIKSGGYESKEEFITHLSENVIQACEDHK